MQREWALELSYVVDILTVVLLIICVLQMAWTTLGYLKSSDSRFIESFINRFLRSVFGITVLMLLTVLNRFSIVALFGSTDVYRNWQIAHATDLSTFTWSVSLAVFGMHATIACVRLLRKKTKKKIEQPVALQEYSDALIVPEPTQELNKILYVIEKRY